MKALRFYQKGDLRLEGMPIPSVQFQSASTHDTATDFAQQLWPG